MHGAIKYAVRFALAFATASHETAVAAPSSTFECLVDAASRIKISAPVAGLISTIYADRGDRVNKGQILAELESSVEEASFRIAKNRAENDNKISSAKIQEGFRRRKADRFEQLRASNNMAESQADEATTDAAVSAIDVREAQFDFEAANLEMQRAAAILEQRKIRSSVDGVVVERSLGPGEYSNEQAHIFTIAQLDPLHVEVFLPTIFYNQIYLGQSAIVTLETPVEGQYSATVKVVDRVFDAATGTFGARLDLPNPNYDIPAGVRCHVVFEHEIKGPQ